MTRDDIAAVPTWIKAAIIPALALLAGWVGSLVSSLMEARVSIHDIAASNKACEAQVVDLKSAVQRIDNDGSRRVIGLDAQIKNMQDRLETMEQHLEQHSRETRPKR